MIAPIVCVEAGRDAILAGARRVDAQRARARAALELAFARIGRSPLEATTNSDGAPVATAGWHWSQSHTRDCAAAVVSTEPVGIDVEPIELRRAVQLPNVVSAAERKVLGEIDALLFTRLWTAKEAVLKRTGVGLAELSDCRVIKVLDATHMWLTHRGVEHRVEQSIRRGFVVSVAAGLAAEAELDWTWSA